MAPNKKQVTNINWHKTKFIVREDVEGQRKREKGKKGKKTK